MFMKYLHPEWGLLGSISMCFFVLRGVEGEYCLDCFEFWLFASHIPYQGSMKTTIEP